MTHHFFKNLFDGFKRILDKYRNYFNMIEFINKNEKAITEKNQQTIAKLDNELKKKNQALTDMKNRYDRLKEDFDYNYNVVLKEREQENDELTMNNQKLENISFNNTLKKQFSLILYENRDLKDQITLYKQKYESYNSEV